MSEPVFRLRCPACAGELPLVAGKVPRCAGCDHALREEQGVIVLDDEPGAGDYPAEVCDVIAAIEDRHWWHDSRNDVIRFALAPEVQRRGLRTLLEVGCGTGFVLAQLERMGFQVCGLDMLIEALRHARRRTSAALLRSGREEIPLAAPVDVVALCDVLEHTEEEPLLSACRGVLRPGGLLLVTVPALPSLWSLEDELSGHRRRYTRRTLRDALARGGFRPVCVRPFHAAITPFIFLIRTLARKQAGPPPDPSAFFEASLAPPGRFASALVRSWLRLENRLGTVVPLPFGSSLLALAEPAPTP